MRRLGGRRDGRRGYALLVVLAMASAVALLLYKELPRAVFESQRVKEDMLVERGEEYKMAIRRYYMKVRRFPQTMDDLDKTNGQRFLRRRYKDPFTGKDEWKLIKMDAAGNLIDSVQSKKSVTDKEKGGTGSVSLGSSLGDAGNQTGAAEGQDVTKRRASDKGIGADLAMQQYQQRGSPDFAGQGGQGGQSGQGGQGGQGGQNGQVGDPNNPAVTTIQMPPGLQQLASQVSQPGQQGQQGQAQTGQSGVPQIPGQQFPPGTLPPGIQLPGMMPQQQPSSGSAMTQQGLGGGGSPMTQQGLGSSASSGNSGTGHAGFNPLQGVMPPGVGVANGQIRSAPNHGAIQGIMQGLTNPAGGQGVGTAGTMGAGAMGTGATGMPNGALQQGAGMFGGGGIVGVASKYKAEGIKLVEERSKINEWEFIYDPRKDKRVTGVQGGGARNAPAGSAPTGSSMGTGMGSGTSGSFGSRTGR